MGRETELVRLVSGTYRERPSAYVREGLALMVKISLRREGGGGGGGGRGGGGGGGGGGGWVGKGVVVWG